MSLSLLRYLLSVRESTQRAQIHTPGDFASQTGGHRDSRETFDQLKRSGARGLAVDSRIDVVGDFQTEVA
jgi:hypothetical protein